MPEIINQLPLKIKQNNAMNQVEILLNGECKFCDKETSIADLLNELELDIEKIAIERNLEIVMPQDFAKTILVDNDKIEIVHFIGGG